MIKTITIMSVSIFVLLTGCTPSKSPPKSDLAKNEPTALIIQKEELLKEEDPLVKEAELGKNVIADGNKTYDTPKS